MIAQGYNIVKNIAKDTILLGIKVAQAAAALVGVSASTLGIGTVVALAAAAAGIAYLNSITKADDMVSEPGYGSRTLMGPEGTIALNNKDTVIAGTDLFPGGGKNSSTDNSEVVGLLKTLISAVNQGGDVFLDGTKVGYTLALQSSKMG